MDLESNSVDRTHTGSMVERSAHTMLAQMYDDEVHGALVWRQRWKKVGDSFEAVSKGLTGISAVLAFAASAVDSIKTADILSFTSGTIGTMGLVLLTYATYASKESRQRTTELNTLLRTIGVTPVPQITEDQLTDE